MTIIMTQEDYVSFETAKLLKEKGFNYPCRVVYSPKGIVKHYLKEEVYAHHLKGHKKLCPTLQMAMKWLRKVHNIIVSPYALSLGYYFEIFDLTNRDITGCKPLYKIGIPNKEDILSTYEQACEAGIKYCLENLI